MKKRTSMLLIIFAVLYLFGHASRSGATILVTSPNGGETWHKRSTYEITWTSTEDIKNVVIELRRRGELYRTINRSVSGSAGRYQWLIPAGIEPGSNYRIVVKDSTITSSRDNSDRAFTIAEPVPETSLPTTQHSTSQSLSQVQVPKKVVSEVTTRNDTRRTENPAMQSPVSKNQSQEPAPTLESECGPNNVNQPDLNGAPRWSSSSVRFGNSIELSLPVDGDTGYVNVVVHNTRQQNGRWMATAGTGLKSITRGRAQTVTVSVRINPLPGSAPLSGDYFPTITLCRSAEECTSGTGMNISYAGHGSAIASGVKYSRIYNEGFRNVSNTISCYSIPILTVMK